MYKPDKLCRLTMIQLVKQLTQLWNPNISRYQLGYCDITFIPKRKSAICNMCSWYNFEGSRCLYFFHISTRNLILQNEKSNFKQAKLQQVFFQVVAPVPMGYIYQTTSTLCNQLTDNNSETNKKTKKSYLHIWPLMDAPGGNVEFRMTYLRPQFL